MTNLPDRQLKADPTLFDTEQKLRQGNYLRGESRQLRRLLDDDAALVASLDVDMDHLTGQMERLYREAAPAFGDPVVVDGKYEVSVREDRGKTACPWGDRFFAQKAVVYAKNLKTGISIKFSLLGLHMLKRHGFFQGAGSPFRIEPEDLKNFFQS
mgnify:CR=1 FL=1